MRYVIEVWDHAVAGWKPMDSGDMGLVRSIPLTYQHSTERAVAEWNRAEVTVLGPPEIVQFYRYPRYRDRIAPPKGEPVVDLAPARIEPVGQLFAVPSDVQRIADKVNELVAAVNRLEAKA